MQTSYDQTIEAVIRGTLEPGKWYQMKNYKSLFIKTAGSKLNINGIMFFAENTNVKEIAYNNQLTRRAQVNLRNKIHNCAFQTKQRMFVYSQHGKVNIRQSGHYFNSITTLKQEQNPRDGCMVLTQVHENGPYLTASTGSRSYVFNCYSEGHEISLISWGDYRKKAKFIPKLEQQKVILLNVDYRNEPKKPFLLCNNRSVVLHDFSPMVAKFIDDDGENDNKSVIRHFWLTPLDMEIVTGEKEETGWFYNKIIQRYFKNIAEAKADTRRRGPNAVGRVCFKPGAYDITGGVQPKFRNWCSSCRKSDVGIQETCNSCGLGRYNWMDCEATCTYESVANQNGSLGIEDKISIPQQSYINMYKILCDFEAIPQKLEQHRNMFDLIKAGTWKYINEAQGTTVCALIEHFFEVMHNIVKIEIDVKWRISNNDTKWHQISLIDLFVVDDVKAKNMLKGGEQKSRADDNVNDDGNIAQEVPANNIEKVISHTNTSAVKNTPVCDEQSSEDEDVDMNGPLNFVAGAFNQKDEHGHQASAKEKIFENVDQAVNNKKKTDTSTKKRTLCDLDLDEADAGIKKKRKIAGSNKESHMDIDATDTTNSGTVLVENNNVAVSKK